MISYSHLLKKSIALGFLCSSFFIFSFNAYGQLPRAEKKMWKKELRKLSPEGMKSLMEEKKQLSSLLTTLNTDNAQLKSQIFEKKQENTYLKSQVRELSNELKGREIQLGLVNENGEKRDSGVVFKVQIGALKPSDFVGQKDRSYTLEVEEDSRHRQYVVGSFSDYEEADALKKLMRKIGMNKAWIVPYKNGSRVPLKEVLDVVLAD